MQAIIAYADNESVEPSTLTDITDIENGVSAKFKGSEIAFVRAELSQVSGKLEEELQFAQVKGMVQAYYRRTARLWHYSRLSMMT